MKANERVVIYGSLGLRRGISDLLWAFRKANRLEEFPAYLDDHPFQVMRRIRDEKANGIKTADVVLMPHYAVMSLGNEGMLSGYRPTGFDSGARYARGHGAGAIPIGVTFMAMAYNKRVLKRKELPTDLSELAGSRWRGVLGTQSLTASTAGNLGAWYMDFLRERTGEKRWQHFVDSLAHTNRPRAFDCIDHLMQGLVDEEISVALTVYSLAYFREKTSGSTVDLIDDERIPHMMTFTSAALLDSSSESESAKKFMDFLLTPEAQKIIGSIPGIAPVGRHVKPSYDFEHSYGEKTEFHPTAQEFEGLKSSVELFRKLLLP